MKVRIIRTVKDTNERLSEGVPFQLSPKFLQNSLQIDIDERIRYQTHLGFGGAITESTAYTLAHDMTPAARQEA
jgi:glucosylceramidase